MDHATVDEPTPTPTLTVEPPALPSYPARTPAIEPDAALRPSTRWVQLDALRVFALLGVFAHHLADVRLGGASVLLGEFGVQLFLALSGFLITTVLLRDRAAAEAVGQRWTVALRDFYIRRSLRVFPIYYLVLGVGWALNIPPIRDVIWWFATYTSNIYLSLAGNWDATGPFSHLWSLAVQEQFYLFWAPIMLAAPRRWLLPLTCGMTILGSLYRLYGVLAGLNPVAIRCFTLSNFDALGLGALLALAIQAGWWRVWQRLIRAIILPCGLGTMAFLLWQVDDLPKVRLVATNLGIGAVSCWLISGAVRGFPGVVGRVFESRPLTYLGRISYGLYVYHLLMPLLVAPIARRFGLDYWGGGLMNLALSTAATLLVASLSWRFIESPINDLKRHFRPPS